MLEKCSNPECDAPFDYREGRLIRVSKNFADIAPNRNQRLIQHFWLCGNCAERYVVVGQTGIEPKIRLRGLQFSREHYLHAVTVA